MNEPEALNAAPRGRGARLGSHDLPVFEGTRSRRHTRTPMWRLRLRAEVERFRHRRRLAGVHTLAQFVGFPRSGHSLIGSLVDAHDQAVIAHELDAMGLFRKGLPVSRLPALMASNSETFSAHGRWWNGLSYEVADARHAIGESCRVVGDKKGDWAARWSAEDPSLVDRFRAASPFKCKWILVTRHPLDNVATMSLRQGRLYDQLRIEAASGAGFRNALAAAQDNGRIAAMVSDEMVADYRALAAAVAAMKARIPAEDWLEIVYEDFAAEPRTSLSALASFLDLEAGPVWLDSASALVRRSLHRSRDSLRWKDRQRAALTETIAARDFLKVYADES